MHVPPLAYDRLRPSLSERAVEGSLCGAKVGEKSKACGKKGWPAARGRKRKERDGKVKWHGWYARASWKPHAQRGANTSSTATGGPRTFCPCPCPCPYPVPAGGRLPRSRLSLVRGQQGPSLLAALGPLTRTIASAFAPDLEVVALSTIRSSACGGPWRWEGTRGLPLS